MTISGVDPPVALPPVAAIGDFRRFGRPEQLVSYLGLNPWVKQSGCLAATHGKTPSRVAGTPEACSPRGADRDRCDRSQAGVSVLDDDRARRGRCVRAPDIDRQEAPGARAASWDASPAREEGNRRRSVKEVHRPSSNSPSRPNMHTASPSPTGMPTLRQSTSRAGRRQWDATEEAL